MYCSKCGETYEDCKSPLSHSVPTINTINLPGDLTPASAPYAGLAYGKALTQRDRNTFNRVDMFFPPNL